MALRALAMLLHTALDLTNTYGTAVFSPLSWRRFCTEWVFFIDAVVLTVSVVAVLLQLLAMDWISPAMIAIAYGGFLLGYWVLRALLYRQAKKVAPPGTLSLIPSALVPWRYFGRAGGGDHIRLFRLDALTGRIDQEQRHTIYDTRFIETLMALPEFRIMRELLPAYHAIEVKPIDAGTCLTCRDLRVRNFGGRFGELIVILDVGGNLVRRDFHV